LYLVDIIVSNIKRAKPYKQKCKTRDQVLQLKHARLVLA